MTGGDDPETRWVTYPELMTIRGGISYDSAMRLVHRHKAWKRVTGNDGKVRIAVPLEYLEPPKKRVGDDVGRDVGRDESGLSDSEADIRALLHGTVDRVDLAVAALERLIAAQERVARAEGRAEAAETELAALRQEVVSLRQAGDAAAAQIRALEAAVQATEERDAQRRGEGLVQRLRRAVRPMN